MNWNPLNTTQELAALKEKSFERPQLIFKHSIRCSISAMAKGRLERKQAPTGIDFYYLDLINNRSLSNEVAGMFGITHESPQVILVKNGEAIYHESHNGISMDEISAQELLS